MYLLLLTALPVGLLFVIYELAETGDRARCWKASIKGLFVGIAAYYLSYLLGLVVIPRYDSFLCLFQLWIVNLLAAPAIVTAGFLLFYKYTAVADGDLSRHAAISFNAGAYAAVCFFAYFEYRGSPTMFMTLGLPLVLAAFAVMVPAFVNAALGETGAHKALLFAAPVGLTLLAAFAQWLEIAKLGVLGFIIVLAILTLPVLVLSGRLFPTAPRRRTLVTLDAD